MKIQANHIRPPIPSRNFDWRAVDGDTYDGAPDSPTRNHIGYGSTEAKAINDLKAKSKSAVSKAELGERPIWPCKHIKRAMGIGAWRMTGGDWHAVNSRWKFCPFCGAARPKR